MRAFFGLKRSIMRSKLSFKATVKLFDSLIKPILLYGAPLWTPESSISKCLIKSTTSKSQTSHKIIKTIGNSIQEKVHLSFLKWALGVHRKASNIGVWGECGRLPLFYQCLRLTLNFCKRISTSHQNSLVHAAFKEQQSMKLPWYNGIKPFLELDDIYDMDHVTAYYAMSGKSITKEVTNHGESVINTINDLKPLKSRRFRVGTIIDKLCENFKVHWDTQKSSSTKLSFYNSVKEKFGCEPYIDMCKGFTRRSSTTKLRISAHNFEIERGRYSNTPREKRFCPWCRINKNLEVVEDEHHALNTCELYSKHRLKIIKQLKEMGFNNVETDLAHNLMEILSLHNINPKENRATLSGKAKVNNTNGSTHQENSNKAGRPKKSELNQDEQSYLVNSVCSYIYRCSEERNTFTNKPRSKGTCIPLNFQFSVACKDLKVTTPVKKSSRKR